VKTIILLAFLMLLAHSAFPAPNSEVASSVLPNQQDLDNLGAAKIHFFLNLTEADLKKRCYAKSLGEITKLDYFISKHKPFVMEFRMFPPVSLRQGMAFLPIMGDEQTPDYLMLRYGNNGYQIELLQTYRIFRVNFTGRGSKAIDTPEAAERAFFRKVNEFFDLGFNSPSLENLKISRQGDFWNISLENANATPIRWQDSIRGAIAVNGSWGNISISRISSEDSVVAGFTLKTGWFDAIHDYQMRIQNREDLKQETGYYRQPALDRGSFGMAFAGVRRLMEENNDQEAIAMLSGLGSGCLPHLMALIQGGNEALIRVFSGVVKGKIAPDSTAAECAAWWEANRDKYILPAEMLGKRGPGSAFWDPYLGF